jgi:hypothetical protein
MSNAPEVAVTLSIELLRHLRDESRRLEIPLEWLVAGLVCDSFGDQELGSNRLAASA